MKCRLLPGRATAVVPLLLPLLLLLGANGTLALKASNRVSLSREDLDSGSSGLNPITRIVELLKKLSKQVEEEGKKEENLYERFVCWATSIINAKESSNAAATDRIQSLETYVKDLEDGKITLTSEEADLTKEIGELSAAIEQANDMRAQEKADFETAEEDMTTAIAALEKAIRVLEAATGGGSSSMLLAESAKVSSGVEARLGEVTLLSKAMDLGSRFLSQGDALFLRRLLTGELSSTSFRLPGEATFKMEYKARSGGIQDALRKLLATFTANLAEAREKEEQAVKEHTTLMGAKQDQLESAQDAKVKLAKEMGARGMSKEESEEEINSLKEQVANDEKFVKQTRDDLATKKAEWKDRQDVRQQELSAISEAISILYSDDNRDLFKKSLASQGYLFMQVHNRRMEKSKATQEQSEAALKILQRTAEQVGDSRFNALLRLASSSRTAAGNFTEVLLAIADMMHILEAQQEKDLKIKEQCESDRASDSRSSAVLSRDIDDLSDQVTTMLAKIKQLKKENKSTTVELVELNKDMDEAAKLRADEHEEWKASDLYDKQAAEVVGRAREVLAKFYEEKGGSLIQVRHREDPPVDISNEPGRAPPPPPSTWDTPYEGKQDEKDGILAILDMVKADIEKDRKKADDEEKDAKAKYDEAVEGFNADKTTLQDAIRTFNMRVGELMGDIGDAKSDQGVKKDELDAVLKKMKEAAPDCKFFTQHFEVRSHNRQLEIQGLQQAQLILSRVNSGS